MRLTANEVRFLTALLREQNQTGCRGPAHDLLRQNAYPRAPLSGPDSLAFSYEAVPLTSLLLKDYTDLQQIDDFLRKGDRLTDPEWPWASPEEFRARLDEARRDWADRKASGECAANGARSRGPTDRLETSKPPSLDEDGN
jgi:hypothetical protein